MVESTREHKPDSQQINQIFNEAIAAAKVRPVAIDPDQAIQPLKDHLKCVICLNVVFNRKSVPNVINSTA